MDLNEHRIRYDVRYSLSLHAAVRERLNRIAMARNVKPSDFARAALLRALDEADTQGAQS